MKEVNYIQRKQIINNMSEDIEMLCGYEEYGVKKEENFYFMKKRMRYRSEHISLELKKDYAFQCVVVGKQI